MNNGISLYNRILMVGLVAMAAACVLWILNVRELRQLQREISKMQLMQQQREPVLKQLVQDVMVYSEKNPSINPILVSIGAKQPAGTAPAPLKK